MEQRVQWATPPATAQTFAAPGQQAEQAGKNAASAFQKGWITAPALQEIVIPEDVKQILSYSFIPPADAQQQLVEQFKQTGDEVRNAFQEGATQTPIDFGGLTDGLQTAADTATQLAQALYDRIKSIFAQPIPVAFSGFGGAIEGAPFAGGGRGTGPGSWPSDTTLAS